MEKVRPSHLVTLLFTPKTLLYYEFDPILKDSRLELPARHDQQFAYNTCPRMDQKFWVERRGLA